jgi:hypothetical protein
MLALSSTITLRRPGKAFMTPPWEQFRSNSVIMNCKMVSRVLEVSYTCTAQSPSVLMAARTL